MSIKNNDKKLLHLEIRLNEFLERDSECVYLLKKYVNNISVTNPSTKINKSKENYCILAINNSILTTNYSNNNFNKYINLCTIDDITEIYEFLINNNYVVNNELSNILNNNCNNYNNKKLLFTFNYKN